MEFEEGQLVTGRCVWKGADLKNDTSWVWIIPPAGLVDIDAALQKVKRQGLAVSEIGKEDFPLPSIAADLAQLGREIEEGIGFQLLRGLPVTKYSVDELRTIFWGIGRHFGRPVKQTSQGDWLIDVRDEGGTLSQNQRGYHSPVTLDFHTDGAGIVGLLCIERAKTGGVSVLASAAAVHNELLRRRPDDMRIFYEGFPVDRRGAQPAGEPRVSPWKLPVFSSSGGFFACVYDRRSSQWGRDLAGKPVTDQEKSLFDEFDALTHDAQYRLDMELQPGDMQFVSNFTVLHSRTSFVDDVENNKRRHLLRLWLDVPGTHRKAINKLHLYTSAPLPDGVKAQRVA